jgi:hypothetical protein
LKIQLVTLLGKELLKKFIDLNIKLLNEYTI